MIVLFSPEQVAEGGNGSLTTAARPLRAASGPEPQGEGRNLAERRATHGRKETRVCGIPKGPQDVTHQRM